MDIKSRVETEFRANPSGPTKIYERLKLRGVKVSLEQVRRVMAGPPKKRGKGRDESQGIREYLDYLRPARTKGLRANGLFGLRGAKTFPITANRPGDFVEADLIDANRQPILFEGERFKYALVVIDDFSKYAWAFPLRTKTKADIKRAFEALFKKLLPKAFMTDREAAIVSLQSWFEELGVEWVNKGHSAPSAESLIRTLKRKANRLNDIAGDREVDLQTVLEKYNEDIHSAHGFSPKKVFSGGLDYQEAARARQLVRRDKAIREAREFYESYDYQPGDEVHVAKSQAFLKGTANQWGDSVYAVQQPLAGNTVVLRSEGGHLMNRFPWEIRKVPQAQAKNRVLPARAAAKTRKPKAQPVEEAPAPRPKRAPKARALPEADLEGEAGGRRYQGREKRGDYFERPNMAQALAALKPKTRAKF